MSDVPDAAIEAGREAVARMYRKATPTTTILLHGDIALAAIEAAMPAIREHIAQEIEAELEYDGFEDGWDTALDRCLTIVRGGTP